VKKILTLLLLSISVISFSQSVSKDTTKVAVAKADSTKDKVCGYISWGVSVTNSSNFLQSSYTGLEGGITYGDFGAGVIFGRGSLQGMLAKDDNIRNYFYEVKTFYSKPIKKFTATVLFGFGGYIATKHNFIEYGAGVSYSVKHMSYGITVSNWDGTTYLTPSITYNF
jgi:hypothetical protein